MKAATAAGLGLVAGLVIGVLLFTLPASPLHKPLVPAGGDRDGVVAIGTNCLPVKSDVVHGHKGRNFTWHFRDDCADHDGKLVTIEFTQGDPSDGPCKCSAGLQGGNAEIVLHIASAASGSYPYTIWIGSQGNPKEKSVDPRLEVDP